MHDPLDGSGSDLRTQVLLKVREDVCWQSESRPENMALHKELMRVFFSEGLRRENWPIKILVCLLDGFFLCFLHTMEKHQHDLVLIYSCCNHTHAHTHAPTKKSRKSLGRENNKLLYTMYTFSN